METPGITGVPLSVAPQRVNNNRGGGGHSGAFRDALREQGAEAEEGGDGDGTEGSEHGGLQPEARTGRRDGEDGEHHVDIVV